MSCFRRGKKAVGDAQSVQDFIRKSVPNVMPREKIPSMQRSYAGNKISTTRYNL